MDKWYIDVPAISLPPPFSLRQGMAAFACVADLPDVISECRRARITAADVVDTGLVFAARLGQQPVPAKGTEHGPRRYCPDVDTGFLHAGAAFPNILEPPDLFFAVAVQVHFRDRNRFLKTLPGFGHQHFNPDHLLYFHPYSFHIGITVMVVAPDRMFGIEPGFFIQETFGGYIVIESENVRGAFVFLEKKKVGSGDLVVQEIISEIVLPSHVSTKQVIG